MFLFVIFLFITAVDAVHGLDFSFSVGMISGEVRTPYFYPDFGKNKLWLAASFRAYGFHHLALEPEVSFTQAYKNFNRCPAPRVCRELYYERDTTAGANLLYRISGEKVGLRFGAGASAHFWREQLQVQDPLKRLSPWYSNSVIEPGFQVLGGAEFRVTGAISLLAMTRAEMVKGSLDHFKLYTGFRFQT